MKRTKNKEDEFGRLQKYNNKINYNDYHLIT